MGDKSAIQWTQSDDGTPGATWNPVLGCSRVSDGCTNCYALRVTKRMAGFPATAEDYLGLVREKPGMGLDWTGRIRLLPGRLDIPLHWKRPRRVFVNSLSDLFHPSVRFEFIAQIFGVMAVTPQHTYQILTKRPERMARVLRLASLRADSLDMIDLAVSEGNAAMRRYQGVWPLPNVWLGTSVEDQATADERIPWLLEVPAAVRFLSCEPLLGPLDLSRWLLPVRYVELDGDVVADVDEPELDWVVTGGESGPRARPLELHWLRSLRDQCGCGGVPFFCKQLGRRPELRDSHDDAPLAAPARRARGVPPPLGGLPPGGRGRLGAVRDRGGPELLGAEGGLSGVLGVREAGGELMHWQRSHRADPAALPLADRHYTRQSPGSPQFVPPGRCLVLRTEAADALWTSSWPFPEFVRHAWAGAWLCSLFRNESACLSSELITEAVAATRALWGEPPTLGFVTFVDAGKVRHKRDPGRCFLRAGWRVVGRTKGGLVVLQQLPDAMPEPALPLGAQLEFAAVRA